MHTGVTADAIEQDGGRLAVRFTEDGRRQRVEAARVVNGAGREPAVIDLDLDAAGIDHEGPRIQVDRGLRSVSNPAVYVAGDALWSSPQLSPVATYEGRLVGRSIATAQPAEPDYRTVPSAVYTVPALASIGLSEA